MIESKWKAMAEASTILRCVVGSQAYGLAKEASSDRDEKGVCVEPFDVYCTLGGKFEQYEFRTAAERTGKKDAPSEPGDLDLTIYGLEKFLRLAVYGNPNIVELLFISGDCLLEVTDEGTCLRDLAYAIISREAGRRYLGYMEAQKQRLLGERGQMRVTRTDLIEEFGYDTKYASHLIRLGFQGVELLETGRLVLPMDEPNRSVVLDIKNGKNTLNYVLQLAGDLEVKLKDLIKDGPIRSTPDMVIVERFMQNAYRAIWENNRSYYVDVATQTIQ